MDKKFVVTIGREFGTGGRLSMHVVRRCSPRRSIVPNSSLGSLNNTQVQWMRFVQRHQIGGVGSSNSQRVQVQLVPFSFI